MRAIGRTRWVIPGGHMVTASVGPEPAFTSHDQACLLNTSDRMANVRGWVYYPHADRVGPYVLTVAPRRIRRFRLNDLIDPVAIPLDVDYAVAFESDVPIVVQFTRAVTSQAALATLGGLAYPDDK